MAKYVEEGALVLKLDWDNDIKKWTLNDNDLEQLPTADVVEVKHGEWVSDTHNSYRKFCSICGRSRPRRNDHEFASSTNYCPSCGAKMDGGTYE